MVASRALLLKLAAATELACRGAAGVQFFCWMHFGVALRTSTRTAAESDRCRSRSFASMVQIVMAALVVLPIASGAQTQTVITGEGCGSCLRFASEIVLGDDTESGSVSRGRNLVRLRDGSFLHATGAGELVRFSASGQPVERFGREGSGPMEFRSADFLVRDEYDTLLVFDVSNGRAVTVSPSRTHVRQFTLTDQVTNAALLPNGDVVANVHFASVQRFGIPLHVIDRRSGAILSSFGLQKDEVFDAMEAWAGWRELSVSPQGTIWTARRNRYVLEEFDQSGRKLREIIRRADWFPAYTRRIDLSPAQAPQPYIERIHVDSKGRIWVFSVVASPGWRRAIEARRPSAGMRPGFEPTSLSDLHDTMIEVIDPTAGTLLASQRLSGYAWGMLSDSVVYMDAQSREGVPRFRLARVALATPSTIQRR